MGIHIAAKTALGRLLKAAFIASILIQSRLAYCDGWFMYAGNAQHTAVSSVASQPLEVIHWAKPVDLATPSGVILIHYGSPLATPGNTIVVPIKTTSAGSFKVNAFRGKDGTLVWSQTTDYVLPAHNWIPSFSPCLTPANRVYFAGAGGTVYYRDDADPLDRSRRASWHSTASMTIWRIQAASTPQCSSTHRSPRTLLETSILGSASRELRRSA